MVPEDSQLVNPDLFLSVGDAVYFGCHYCFFMLKKQGFLTAEVLWKILGNEAPYGSMGDQTENAPSLVGFFKYRFEV